MSNRLLHKSSDYVIFTSSNGIKFSLINAEKTIGKEAFIKALNKTNVISIGELTKKAGIKEGIKTSILPKIYSSKGIIEELKNHNLKDKVIEILRSSHGSNALIKELKNLNAIVNDICVYSIQLPKDIEKPKELIKRAINNEVDIFTFSSTMTIINFFKIAEMMECKERLIKIMNKRIVASIGLPTKEKLNDFGIEVKIMPKIFSFEEMIKEIKRVVN